MTRFRWRSVCLSVTYPNQWWNIRAQMRSNSFQAFGPILQFSMAAKLSLGGAIAGTGTSDLSIDDIIAAIPMEARFDNSGKHAVVGDLIPNLTGSELQLAVDKMYLRVMDRGLCVGVTWKLPFSPRHPRVSKNCPLHVSAMGHEILCNLGRVLELARRHWWRRDRLAPHARTTERSR